MKIFDAEQAELAKEKLIAFIDNERSLIFMDKTANALKENRLPNALPQEVMQQMVELDGGYTDHSLCEPGAYYQLSEMSIKTVPFTDQFSKTANDVNSVMVTNKIAPDEKKYLPIYERVTKPLVAVHAESPEAIKMAQITAWEQLQFILVANYIFTVSSGACHHILDAMEFVEAYIEERLDELHAVEIPPIEEGVDYKVVTPPRLM